MNTVSADLVELTDLQPSRDDLLGDVLAGLSGTPKRLPSKYFYDRRGSELFEEITRQPEYYLTRVELALLEAECANIAAVVGPRAHVVEYGSGSGRKTRLLLDALQDPVAYTPVEISRSALVGSVERLDREFGPVQMLPVLGDFTQPVPLPEPERELSNYVPRAPETAQSGQVVSVYGNAVNYAAQNQVVTINRGRAHGNPADHEAVGMGVVEHAFAFAEQAGDQIASQPAGQSHLITPGTQVEHQADLPRQP